MESLFINKFHAIYAAIDIFSIMLWSTLHPFILRLPMIPRSPFIGKYSKIVLLAQMLATALKIKRRVYDFCQFGVCLFNDDAFMRKRAERIDKVSMEYLAMFRRRISELDKQLFIITSIGWN